VVGHEALDLTDRDRVVDLTTAAHVLAESGADPPADHGERVCLAVHGECLGVPTLRHQGQIGGHVHPGRAGAHTWGAHQLLASGGRAAALGDVGPQLVLEVPENRQDRGGGQLAEGAEGSLLHAHRQVTDPIDVVGSAPAGRDALEDLQHSQAADAARRALAAALVTGEPQEVGGELDHAGGLVGHDHAARAHHGARRPQRIEVHRGVQVRLGQAAPERAPGLYCLESFPPGDATADVEDDVVEGDAHRHLNQAGPVHHPR
jgi:hypothetical protein